MATGAPEITSALDDLITTITRDLGTGFSAVLYGSLARGDWQADHSDVNLLLVVDDPAPAVLTRLTAASHGWHERGFTPPLITGRAEWLRATDVFPIEVTDMRLSYRVLVGDDPVAGLQVDLADLRRALEASWRGKLLRMRQAFLRFGDDADALGRVATASTSELLVLLRCTAVLCGRTPGRTPSDAVTAVQDLIGTGDATLREVLARRRSTGWSCPPLLFASFLDALASLVHAVDRFSPSGGT
ncbi:MAG TPA: nucleotidyltransferase domain-containing protein [Gemmatimonadales bacterium]|nr:nucleotidyltransferase domain-containing protein [Gemmatimonadales bacterium]